MTQLLTGIRHPVVTTLPAASANTGKTLAQGSTLWYSNGTTWIDLGASSGGGISDGDKGDIVVSGSGTVWTVEDGAIGLPKLGETAVAAFAPALHVGSGGSSGGDLSYSRVVALIHANGLNGSTAFSDNAPSPKIYTAMGNAQVSTAQSKFGGASLLLDGTGDYLTTPNSPEFYLSEKNFTIEAWIYPTNASAGSNFFGNVYQVICAQWQVPIASNGAFFFGLINMRPLGTLMQNGNNVGSVMSSSAVALNAWTHIAYVRNGGTCDLYVNGVLSGSTSIFGLADASSRSINIGADSGNNCCFQGFLDDIRCTNGVARYTADFTPPTSQFEDFGGGQHLEATSALSGFMSSSDKAKLDATLAAQVTITYPTQGASVITRDITVAGAIVGQKVIATPSLDMPSGVAQDELEMDMLSCAGAVIAANTVRLIVSSFNGAIISGQRNINIQLSN